MDVITEEKNVIEFDFDESVARVILADIKNEFGLDYSKQEHITMKKLQRFSIKNEINSFVKLQKLLQSSKETKENLVNMLTVGETYFYRELGHIKILAEMMQERKIEKILCAPSSSGEEVYSIIMYLKENNLLHIPFHVTGIDVNTDAIMVAKKAFFSKRSVSLLPEHMLKSYFSKEDTRYQLERSVQHYATFKQQNIFDKELQKLGVYDAVFCRNMLIYFDEKDKREAIANIRSVLSAKGILFIGHADISFLPEGFEKKISCHGSYFQKT